MAETSLLPSLRMVKSMQSDGVGSSQLGRSNSSCDRMNVSVESRSLYRQLASHNCASINVMSKLVCQKCRTSTDVGGGKSIEHMHRSIAHASMLAWFIVKGSCPNLSAKSAQAAVTL